ncbi:asparagine synthase [Diplogelasinospora grovesii]|uniref:Asparagine synthase n=1 Tax=Diplogelasinospora grovesii TaxID=303347 RepID=A0AAN6RZY0_9PEZI|nr:asparagine synthase [Diplogelasinospora grovesii]
MCGITVSIALSSGKVPSQASDHVNGRDIDEKTAISHNGHSDQHASLRDKLNRSLDLIAHRGPDSKGVWISENGAVGLAHNRLSINDLSADGDQPIHSDDGQIHAVVNGEIYDHDRIRDEFMREHGYHFKSRADTEVVVALYKHYGAPKFLEHLRGEFALVLYDEGLGKVIAARDRFGIKPLFYTRVRDDQGERLLLAAEAKAFLALDWKAEWDVGAIVDGGWQHDNRTLFSGVLKVLPGHWMEVTLEGGHVQEHRYWDLEYKDKRDVETRPVEEMIRGVREHLTEAIRLRLRADVPVGIYLSGGIDSSLVAGIVTHLVREQGVKLGNRDATSRVCCFSIEFPRESGFDESDIAERTAKWLGVQILKKRMDEATLAESFADSVYHCEHHNFDLNSVGKFVLSTVPREHGYKVVLTGEGADEHFAGYPFFPADFLGEADYSMPDSPLTKDNTLREALQHKALANLDETLFHARRLGFFSHGSWKEDCEAFRAVNNVRMPLGAQMSQPTLESLFAPWVQQRYAGVNCPMVAVAALSPESRHKITNKWHPLHASEYIWSKSLLANNILSCLGDRTEMAHSIEARPPFLDHVLSDYVNGLPPSLKVGYTPEKTKTICTGEEDNQDPWWEGVDVIRTAFTEKWILREAGKPFITQELYERKKHPYTAPNRWPKNGPVHRMLQTICAREKVENLGFVNYNAIKNALDTGFGDDADALAFRGLLLTASWVTLSERFGIEQAQAAK